MPCLNLYLIVFYESACVHTLYLLGSYKKEAHTQRIN